MLLLPILINAALALGGAFDRKNRRRVSSVFSSDSARKKWREMQKKVSIAHMAVFPWHVDIPCI